ncbi:hypothetical protein DL770_005327 [Monosporascus sp. CRB-9-2]|nr:hypothetical protein DL770_005327 [Monosporascus sp. CRB-9-2]
MTWLRSAAETCGDKPKAKKVPEAPPSKTPAASQGLKGKARKLAKQAQAPAPAASAYDFPSAESLTTDKYAVSTQELLAQVDAVSTSKANLDCRPPYRPPSSGPSRHVRDAQVGMRGRSTRLRCRTRATIDIYQVLQDALVQLSPNVTEQAKESPGSASYVAFNANIHILRRRFKLLKLQALGATLKLLGVTLKLLCRELPQLF